MNEGSCCGNMNLSKYIFETPKFICKYPNPTMLLLFLLTFTSVNASVFNFSQVITIDHILQSINTNRTTCQGIARIFLSRIRLYNARLGALTILNYRNALADAKRLDSYWKKKRQFFGRLHCVPTLIKDNILVTGLPLTLGVSVLLNSSVKSDANSVWRLKSEGALILGKANLTPFSFGLKAPDEASEIGGQCRNPYGFGTGRMISAFGSSCGNAVGQAARLAVIGLATDTAGSSTYPASVCGLVAIRPPMKIYNTDGIFPLLKTAGDTVSPMAFTVSDAALILDIISASNRSSKFSPTRQNGRPYRLGVIRDFAYANQPSNLSRADGSVYEYYVQAEILNATYRFIDRLRRRNVQVINLTMNAGEFLDEIHKLHRAWIDIFACTPQWMDTFLKKHPIILNRGTPGQREMKNLEDILNTDGMPGHYGRFFKKFKAYKSHCLPSLRRLRKVRTAAKRFLQKRLFDSDDVDALAFPRPHKLPTNWAADSFFMLDPAGALGFPALTLPIGFGYSIEGRKYSVALPIGMYMMTRPRRFKAMLDIARIYELTKNEHDFASNLPPEFE